jgi:hypothetical protein
LPCTVPSCPGKFYLNYNLSKLKLGLTKLRSPCRC